MSIKVEKNLQTKFSGKGQLADITEVGFLIYDEKQESTDTLLFSDLKDLIGKDITFSFASKEITE